MIQRQFQTLLGNTHEIAVERALAEIRSGRPVAIAAGRTSVLAIAAESVEDALLGRLKDLGGAQVRLILSAPRLRLLGQEAAEPGALALGTFDAAAIHDLICHAGARLAGVGPLAASALEAEALELVRLAYLLPAAVVLPLDPPALAEEFGVVAVETRSICHYRQHVLTSPRIVARAPVPLEDVGPTEFVVFRGGEGMRDQVAVVIGVPSPEAPVYMRMHSACLTGDLFASLKCDCGDQLRGTVRRMAEEGGGVLLYLDQEGRGNGIANKIRAYRLQHAGYDTYDADQILGFGLDQRRFDFAAAMMTQLGYRRVRLMTNNPAKVEALEAAGLEVVSSHRVPARHTSHNVSYLAAKRDRGGHIIEDDHQG